MQIEKLTTSLQFIGAALAVPAGIAGVYSAYHSYFSAEVRCQELRNSTLVTLEKNIPAEAKRALLKNDVGQFQAKCGDVEPETAMVFQVALQELDKPAAAPAPKPQRPAAAPPLAAAATTALAAAATTPVAPQGAARPPASPPQVSSPQAASIPAAPAPAVPPATRSPSAAPARAAPAYAAAGPALAAPVAQPPAPPKANLAPGPAVASLGPMARFTRPVHGWVAIEARKPGKVTEAFFSGYPADGQSLPAPGTILMAMAFRPIWSEPQGQGPIDPTRLQGRIKIGECVRVIGTTASLGRQWAEVEPSACP